MIYAVSMHRLSLTLPTLKGEVPFARLHDYTRRHTYIRGIPRRVEHEITRNEMTHPPRIISRKRLIKVRGSTMRTNKTRSAFTHRRGRVRIHGRRRRDTPRLLLYTLLFTPFFLFSSSPPHRHPVVVGGRRSAETASAPE